MDLAIFGSFYPVVAGGSHFVINKIFSGSTGIVYHRKVLKPEKLARDIDLWLSGTLFITVNKRLVLFKPFIWR